MKRNRKLFFFILLVIIGVFSSAIFLLPSKNNNNGKLSVVVSFYPLENFVKEICGDLCHVTNITPSGVEPHDFEPTPQDIKKIYEANMVVYSGTGMENWVDKIANHTNLFVQAAKTIPLIKNQGKPDPHFWLDPLLSVQAVRNIADSLVAVDPANQDTYRKNEMIFIKKLSDLHTEYKKSLSSCAQNNLITSHEVFAYQAQRYGYQQTSIAGLSPENEPTPQDMITLVNEIKNRKIKYILTEEILSTKYADTLSNETGVSIIQFNPLETLTEKSKSSGEDYLSVMKNNLSIISKALECKAQAQ